MLKKKKQKSALWLQVALPCVWQSWEYFSEDRLTFVTIQTSRAPAVGGTRLCASSCSRRSSLLSKAFKNPSMVNNTRSSHQSAPAHRLFINSYTAAELMLGVSLFAANQKSPCSLCVRRSGAQARVCRVCGIHFNSLCVAHTRLYFSGTIHHKCFYHVRKDLAEVLFYLPFSQLRTMRLKNGIRRRPTGKLKLHPS